jgi:SAM-dependent methyltransferase
MKDTNEIAWCNGRTLVECRVCGITAEGAHVASLNDMFGRPMSVRECSYCSSVDLLPEPAPSSSTDESVDLYIEAAAGIGTIAKTLTVVDPQRVRRVADIGCGYGFSLDLGRYLYGWDVVGMEPSLAGERGRTELDLPIHPDYFTAERDLGGDLDLIISSEVLEHIPDPVPFLTAIRGQLADNGVAVFTTPAREVITPQGDQMQAFTALSPGYHCFVASEKGLRLLLARAGFIHFRVWRDGGTLHAVVGMSTASIEPYPGPAISLPQIESWYRDRSEKAPSGSVLATGFRGRLLRSLVSRGDFSAVDALLPALVEDMMSRSDIDLRNPVQVGDQLADIKAPMALSGIAYSLGMRELLHTGNASLAADYFDLAGKAGANFLRFYGYQDMEMVDVLHQSAYHLALALARFAPERITGNVKGFLKSIRNSPWMICRVFVELAARGHAHAGDALTLRAEREAAQVARSTDASERRAGLDALYMLAVVAELSGDASLTVTRLCETLDACLVLGQSSHTVELIRNSLIALDRLQFDNVLMWQVQRAGSNRLFLDLVTRARQVSALVSHAAPLPETYGDIDLFWRDAEGMFVEGWVHAGCIPVSAVSLCVGGQHLEVRRHDRLDLKEAWRSLPNGQRCGFSAYIPSSSVEFIELVLETPAGSLLWAPSVPRESLPLSKDSTEETELHEARVTAHIAAAPAGRVLAIGLRTDDPVGLAQVMTRFGDREVITLDIHPGLGVDIVGDAHRLSTLFELGSFAVVYSNSVIEHVSHPWVIALETARVLMPGGLAVNWVPWVWPTHSKPNDFWRMSPGGLEFLYGRELGYEIVGSGGATEVTVIPGPQSRLTMLNMATNRSHAMSWIAARKVAEPHPEISWPFDAELGESIARAYPQAGLASRERS